MLDNRNGSPFDNAASTASDMSTDNTASNGWDSAPTETNGGFDDEIPF